MKSPRGCAPGIRTSGRTDGAAGVLRAVLQALASGKRGGMDLLGSLADGV